MASLHQQILQNAMKQSRKDMLFKGLVGAKDKNSASPQVHLEQKLPKKRKQRSDSSDSDEINTTIKKPKTNDSLVTYHQFNGIKNDSTKNSTIVQLQTPDIKKASDEDSSDEEMIKKQMEMLQKKLAQKVKKKDSNPKIESFSEEAPTSDDDLGTKFLNQSKDSLFASSKKTPPKKDSSKLSQKAPVKIANSRRDSVKTKNNAKQKEENDLENDDDDMVRRMLDTSSKVLNIKQDKKDKSANKVSKANDFSERVENEKDDSGSDSDSDTIIDSMLNLTSKVLNVKQTPAKKNSTKEIKKVSNKKLPTPTRKLASSSRTTPEKSKNSSLEDKKIVEQQKSPAKIKNTKKFEKVSDSESDDMIQNMLSMSSKALNVKQDKKESTKSDSAAKITEANNELSESDDSAIDDILNKTTKTLNLKKNVPKQLNKVKTIESTKTNKNKVESSVKQIPRKTAPHFKEVTKKGENIANATVKIVGKRTRSSSSSSSESDLEVHRNYKSKDDSSESEADIKTQELVKKAISQQKRTLASKTVVKEQQKKINVPINSKETDKNINKFVATKQKTAILNQKEEIDEEADSSDSDKDLKTQDLLKNLVSQQRKTLDLKSNVQKRKNSSVQNSSKHKHSEDELSEQDSFTKKYNKESKIIYKHEDNSSDDEIFTPDSSKKITMQQRKLAALTSEINQKQSRKRNSNSVTESNKRTVDQDSAEKSVDYDSENEATELKDEIKKNEKKRQKHSTNKDSINTKQIESNDHSDSEDVSTQALHKQILSQQKRSMDFKEDLKNNSLVRADETLETSETIPEKKKKKKKKREESLPKIENNDEEMLEEAIPMEVEVKLKKKKKESLPKTETRDKLLENFLPPDVVDMPKKKKKNKENLSKIDSRDEEFTSMDVTTNELEDSLSEDIVDMPKKKSLDLENMLADINKGYSTSFLDVSDEEEQEKNVVSPAQLLNQLEEGHCYLISSKNEFDFSKLALDNEVYFMKLPKSLHPQLLMDQAMSFKKKTKFIGEKSKYLCRPDKTTLPEAQVIEPGSKTLQNISLAGKFVVEECTETEENEDGVNFSSLDYNPKIYKEIPEDLKDRHPLFGPDYSEKVNLDEEVTRKLQEALNRFCVKKKKKKRTSEKN